MKKDALHKAYLENLAQLIDLSPPLDEIQLQWEAQGKPIEGGWWSYAANPRNPHVAAEALDRLRDVYMMGAFYVCVRALQLLVNDNELSEQEDFRQFAVILEEITRFGLSRALRQKPPAPPS